MNTSLTVADVVSLITGVGLIVGAIYNGRKIRSDVKKTEADAVAVYADTVEKTGELVNKLQDKVNELQNGIRADRKKYEDRIEELEGQIENLRKQVAAKDYRIEELERLTKSQEQELAYLRAEVGRLKKEDK